MEEERKGEPKKEEEPVEPLVEKKRKEGDGGPLLEYERNLINELNKNTADNAQSGLCYTVVARGFSVPKIVACMLYEDFSCST